MYMQGMHMHMHRVSLWWTRTLAHEAHDQARVHMYMQGMHMHMHRVSLWWTRTLAHEAHDQAQPRVVVHLGGVDV